MLDNAINYAIRDKSVRLLIQIHPIKRDDR